MTTMTEMRVWIGCLACYNGGDLVGDWYDASDAGGVSVRRVHDDGGYMVTVDNFHLGPHEELWVMDHEGLPITGECSTAEAQQWAELVAVVGESDRRAFAAYVEAEHSAMAPDSDYVERFREAYAGEWGTLRDYAENLADECGVGDATTDEVPFSNYWHFDYEGFARDLLLGGDCWTAEAPGHGVYVFRSL